MARLKFIKKVIFLEYINFDSRDRIHKSHFGAIESGKFMRLRLKFPKDAGVWNCYFLYREDSWQEFTWHEMAFEFENGGDLYYKIDIKLDTGLYWYRFAYKTEDEIIFINKEEYHKGYASCNDTCFQQTVYSHEIKPPTWLRGGLIYQIFPDRFYFSGQEKKNIPSSRFIRNDWGAQPAWWQNNDSFQLGNDFFKGDLKGVSQKLDYLKDLGVVCIYLNPIFEASSNHRYNTCDYEKIDCLLGNEKDFSELCNEAHKRGMYVILDGVFSHTGDDSKYFDRYNSFENGACKGENSPYYSWYKFTDFPNKYHSWWGIDTLPEVNEDDPNYLEYICGENGILRKWLRLGADGWRLDVADELPDIFLDRLHTAIKEENPDAFILGEVWEDATNKISYGYRRRYLLGKQLDSVMNYPFATAIISFAKGGTAHNFTETIMSVVENYPKESLDILMNHVGTHDTARVLTVLGSDYCPPNRESQSYHRLNNEERQRGEKLQKLAAVLQYTLPGVPSLYYGDEAGMEGWGDPFCRGCYPWGNENSTLLNFYRELGKVRIEHTAFKSGEFIPLCNDGNLLVYLRKSENETLLIAANSGNDTVDYYPQVSLKSVRNIFGEKINNGKITLPVSSYSIIKIK